MNGTLKTTENCLAAVHQVKGGYTPDVVLVKKGTPAGQADRGGMNVLHGSCKYENLIEENR